MIRKFKLFGVLAVAALALTAVAASAAQAAPEFHVESAPATITGEQTGTQKFTTNAGTVECQTATFKGSTSVTTTTTQELIPSYSNCSAFGGFLNASVVTTGCGYLFHLTAGGVSPFPATVDVKCSAGSKITVTAGSCVVTVEAQTGLGGITLTNTGTKTTRDVDAALNVTGVKYNTSSGCINGAATGLTNGVLEGNATIKADVGSTATQQGLFIA
jgi:hypothetical protein